MTTLQDYVAREFPNHDIDLWDAPDAPDLELAPHTVVSKVVGTRDGLDLLNVYRRSAPNARVAALAVRPSSATIVPTRDEDTDGTVDLPASRIATSVAVAAVVIGGVFTGVMLLAGGSALMVTILGVFAALVGAAVGAIVGGARFAGQRATTQPQAAGRTITVIAAFCDDDASASSVAKLVGPAADYDVRIVDQVGGWRSPSVGS